MYYRCHFTLFSWIHTEHYSLDWIYDYIFASEIFYKMDHTVHYFGLKKFLLEDFKYLKCLLCWPTFKREWLLTNWVNLISINILQPLKVFKSQLHQLWNQSLGTHAWKVRTKPYLIKGNFWNKKITTSRKQLYSVVASNNYAIIIQSLLVHEIDNFTKILC